MIRDALLEQRLELQVRRRRRIDALGVPTVLTGLQRATRAALWAALGAVAAIAAATAQERLSPSPVTVLPPVIEHAGELHEIYRLRLELHGVERSCRFVLFKDAYTWSLTC